MKKKIKVFKVVENTISLVAILLGFVIVGFASYYKENFLSLKFATILMAIWFVSMSLIPIIATFFSDKLKD